MKIEVKMVRHKLVRIEIQVAITFIYLFYYYYKQNKQKTQLRNVNFGAKKVWITKCKFKFFKKQNKVKCNLAIARYEFSILREKGWAVVI